MKTTLNKLPTNKVGIIKEINSKPDIKRRLLDLGLIENSNIKKLFKSPLGDPTAYIIKGSIIALRDEDTKDILINYGEHKND